MSGQRTSPLQAKVVGLKGQTFGVAQAHQLGEDQGEHAARFGGVGAFHVDLPPAAGGEVDVAAWIVEAVAGHHEVGAVLPLRNGVDQPARDTAVDREGRVACELNGDAGVRAHSVQLNTSPNTCPEKMRNRATAKQAGGGNLGGIFIGGRKEA